MKAKIICTTLLVENSPQALPLGAACIAAAINHHPLTKDFCKATLIDFNPEDDDFKTHSSSTHTAASWICSILMKEFEKDNTDFSKNVDFKICAFSLFVWNRVILEEVAALLKNEGIICIAGGPEITAHPLDFPVFDYVITGEGETKVPTGLPLTQSHEKNPLACAHWEEPAFDAFKDTVAKQVTAYLARKV